MRRFAFTGDSAIILMNTELLDRIEELAGSQRAKTFRAAAEFILEHKCRHLVETGSYRGNGGDGQSTLILALLAKEVGGDLISIDLNADPISQAGSLLSDHGLRDFVALRQSDSVIDLSSFTGDVNFAYLDSYDHESENPGPCQRHQLAEVGAIIGKVVRPCAILLDDHIAETGGKTALSAAFLKDRGWTLAAEGYQLLYTRL